MSDRKSASVPAKRGGGAMRVALWVSLVCLILSLGGYLALTAYEKTLQSEIASMA